MTRKQAIKIIKECCKHEIQHFAFDANMYERYPAVAEQCSWAKTAYEKREKIKKALSIVIGQEVML
jgi:hypothetical protein